MTIMFDTLDYHTVNYTNDSFTLAFADGKTTTGNRIIEIKTEFNEELQKRQLMLCFADAPGSTRQETLSSEQDFIVSLLRLVVVASIFGKLTDLLTSISSALGPDALLVLEIQELVVVWNDTEFDWNVSYFPETESSDNTPATFEQLAVSVILCVFYNVIVTPDVKMMTRLRETYRYHFALMEQYFDTQIKDQYKARRAQFKLLHNFTIDHKTKPL